MGAPKALLLFNGRTFVTNILDSLRAAAIDHIIVAVAPGDDKILPYLQFPDVKAVLNREPASAGPIASLRSGIGVAVNHAVEYLLVWPVDQPHVTANTARSVCESLWDSTQDIAVPVYEGRRGHPVLFRRAVFQELLEAPDDQGARSVVRRVPSRVLEVPVSDPAVLEDIDTPEDYDRLISSTKSLL